MLVDPSLTRRVGIFCLRNKSYPEGSARDRAVLVYPSLTGVLI